MWWSEEEWARLKDPTTCGMCADAHLEENSHSILVVSTPATRLRIARNQAHRGYCLVILREHATDMADLTPDVLQSFWSDVQKAGRAIADAFGPSRIDYLVMGHRMPHLHCHVLPQHPHDDPLRNVDISDGPLMRTPEELMPDVRRLRAAWLED